MIVINEPKKGVCERTRNGIGEDMLLPYLQFPLVEHQLHPSPQKHQYHQCNVEQPRQGLVQATTHFVPIGPVFLQLLEARQEHAMVVPMSPRRRGQGDTHMSELMDLED